MPSLAARGGRGPAARRWTRSCKAPRRACAKCWVTGTPRRTWSRSASSSNAGPQATRRARRRQIAALQDRVEQCERAAGDAEAFIEADIAFHRAIVQIVDNDIILALHDIFVTALMRGRPPVPDRMEHDRMVVAEHAAIFDAIVTRDVEAAMTTMERHLDRAFRARLLEKTSQK